MFTRKLKFVNCRNSFLLSFFSFTLISAYAENINLHSLQCSYSSVFSIVCTKVSPTILPAPTVNTLRTFLIDVIAMVVNGETVTFQKICVTVKIYQARKTDRNVDKYLVDKKVDCANFFFERSFIPSPQFRFPIYRGN